MAKERTASSVGVVGTWDEHQNAKEKQWPHPIFILKNSKQFIVNLLILPSSSPNI